MKFSTNILSCEAKELFMCELFTNKSNKRLIDYIHLLRYGVSLKLYISIFILVTVSGILKAQDPLMAKANKALTISYGIGNFNKLFLTNYIDDKTYSTTNSYLSYTAKFSNPITLTFDYAVSDYSTIGIAFNYFTFNLSEKRQDLQDTFNLETKGNQMAFQLRGIRYIVQRPRSALYLFGATGLRFRSVEYNTTDQHDIHIAEIHKFAYANPEPYSPLSLEAGMGIKFLITQKIGISSEFGFVTGIAQCGLFYSFKNKWRRTKDPIGW